MADKAISELVAAPSVTPDSLFVLQQDNTAKKLTAQVLENWLVSFADGHGGIQSYEHLKTEGLVKTYRFTLADQTYIDIDVVDGRGIESVKPTSTKGLVVTYTITYNDGTTSTFTVTNGAKGDKGDRADIWVKYASQKPTASSHSFGDVADAWIGIATGHNMDAAPTDWQQYTWFQWKGEKGDPGDPATLVSSEIRYQVGVSGTILPSGSWLESIPIVTPGKFLWTRQVIRFNTGDPVTSYTVSRSGIDGSGAVSTVAGVVPDENGNVPLDASDVKALAISGGTMEGAINMNGQKMKGLNVPAANDEAANMGFVNQQVKKAAPWNMLVNSDFRNPFNQQGLKTYEGSGYGIDRWAASGNSCSVTVSNGYVVFASTSDANQTVRQFIPDEINLYGKTVTLACETTSGTVYCATGVVPDSRPASTVYRCICNIGSAQVRLCISASTHNAVQIFTPNYTIRLRWIALYEGEYTADTLPEYHPKDRAVELAECYRYYLPLLSNKEQYTFFDMVAGWGAILKIDAPVEMQETPDLITFDGTKPSIFHPDSGWVQATVSFSRRVGTTYYYAITVPSGYTFNDGTEYLIKNLKCLDANLN